MRLAIEFARTPGGGAQQQRGSGQRIVGVALKEIARRLRAAAARGWFAIVVAGEQEPVRFIDDDELVRAQEAEGQQIVQHVGDGRAAAVVARDLNGAMDLFQCVLKRAGVRFQKEAFRAVHDHDPHRIGGLRGSGS